MSLWIDVDAVTHVLLADGWHEVDGNSYGLDSYEYHYQEHPCHGGGQSGVCATGFQFRGTDRRTYAGPLTSVLAVRTR